MISENKRNKAFLIFLLVLVPLLMILAWSQASFNLNFIRPSNAQETILLLALSTFIFVAFFIFAFILSRILLKLYIERMQGQLGSQFKTKMVVAFLTLSLVPVAFLFAFAYGLLNRSVDKWFGIPFDAVRQDSAEIVRQVDTEAKMRASHDAGDLTNDEDITRAMTKGDPEALAQVVGEKAANLGLDAVLCFDRAGHLMARVGGDEPPTKAVISLLPWLEAARGNVPAAPVRFRAGKLVFFLAARNVGPPKMPVGSIVTVARLPESIASAAADIQREADKYDELSRDQKIVKRNAVSTLLLVTLLILFAATWLALFLSKQVTVPIQALAEGTHQVSSGNLGFQVSAKSTDELGVLIRSFNQMTAQLQENRLAIDRAAKELQAANRKLEERGHTMEAILENIPTGVVSFDTEGRIIRVNSMLERMLGERAKTAQTLSDLFSPEDAKEISRLFRRATRQGVVARQMDLELEKGRAFVALTLSSVRARHGAVGMVLVLEDLTDMLRAEKAAAWREVAQRIAHEIKNPLTPIQLSAERIRRLVDRAGPSAAPGELSSAVSESAALIDREVATLKTLVDEFSAFARFPSSKPSPSDLNAVVKDALNVFDGRLSGINVHRDLASDLPLLQIDPEQMKRVVVNLVDNAAEALGESSSREIWIRTALNAENEAVELEVADSGPGIPPEIFERLFLPYFSTKRRGTGLGLAIVNRIVSEHNGTIRVEDNHPTGAKFVIELPVDRAAALNGE